MLYIELMMMNWWYYYYFWLSGRTRRNWKSRSDNRNRMC